MSEENEVTVEETTSEVQPTSSTIDNLEDALKELDKVRREAAGRRVKNKEAEEKAKLWEEHVQAQKTDLEKLTENVSALQSENARLKHEQLREKVARDSKLDPEDFEFLIGDTEDELKAKAEKLNSRRGKQTADFYAGQRGTRVDATKEETADEWFMKEWRKAGSGGSSTKLF